MSAPEGVSTLEDMRPASLSLLAFALACGTSPDEPGNAGGTNGGGNSTTASGGSTLGGGGTMNGGAPSAGTANGGSTAGSSAGGQPAGGSPAAAGRAAGGSAGSSSTSGAPSAGSGGGGACVENLGCKLDPPPATGDLQQDCVNRINQFLTQCACLPPLKRRTDGEACANQMAKYDADHDEAHAGVRAMICQPGGAQNSCPGYGSNNQVIGLCLQQMWDEGPPPRPDCTGDCYQEHGHFINMTDPEVTQVACGFYTTESGKVWAVQNFTR